MFHGYYILWALLWIALFGFAAWGQLKRYFGVPGKEDIRSYLGQAIFCLVSFGIAVGIDQWVPEGILVDVTSDMVHEENEWVLRVLIYPAVLLALSYVQRYFCKEKQKEQQLGKPKRFV